MDNLRMKIALKDMLLVLERESLEGEALKNYFKSNINILNEEIKNETRVYVIDGKPLDANNFFKEAMEKKNFEAIKRRAEEEGGTYTLEGFQKAFNNNNLSVLSCYIYIGDNSEEDLPED